MSRWARRLGLGLLALLALAAAAFLLWALTPLGPMPEAETALVSDERVTVSEAPWLSFTPTGETPRSGFVLYPGGRVDPRSYAPIARAACANV